MPRIIITEPGKSPQPYRLKVDRSETKIGRGSDNDILIEAGSASTHHCVMKRGSGGFILQDLGSTNGIKVSDTLFRIIDLEDGMFVKIGDDVTLEYTLTDDEITVLGAEAFKSRQQAMLPKADPTPAIQEQAEEDFFEGLEDFEDEMEEEEEERYSPPSVARRGMSSILYAILAILALALGFYARHYQDVIMAPAKDAPALAPASD